MLAALYVSLFVLLIFLLVRACRARKGVGMVLILNVFSAVLACFLLWYFDTLPGYGLMPGFAFFPEVMYSLMAALAFAVLTLVTLLIWLFRRKDK